MKRMISFAALGLALILGGGWLLMQGGTQTATSLPMAANAQQAEVDTSGIVEMVQGQADAPVEVIEYASYTCPHCADFHTEVYPRLKKDYIDTAKIRLVYREVYFDKYGMWASLVARCGGPDRFFGITDLIFDGQRGWSRAGSDNAIAGELRKIGRLAGLGEEKLDACMADGDKLRALVAWYQQNATKHDINSTPSFVIDGEKFPNMSYADFAAAIDKKLAAK